MGRLRQIPLKYWFIIFCGYSIPIVFYTIYRQRYYHGIDTVYFSLLLLWLLYLIPPFIFSYYIHLKGAIIALIIQIGLSFASIGYWAEKAINMLDIYINLTLLTMGNLFIMGIGILANKVSQQQKTLTKTRKELTSKQHQLNSILEKVDIVLWSIDAKSTSTIQITDGFRNIFGRHTDMKNPRKVWKEAIHPEDLSMVLEQQSPLLAGKELHIEYRIIDLKGKVKWVHDHTIPILDKHNHLTQLDVVLIDITKSKELLQKIQESEQLFRNVFEKSGLGIAVTTLDGQLLKANKRLHQILGYSENELMNLHYSKITHPDSYKKETILYEQLIKAERNHYELEKQCYTKNGHIIWGKIIVSLINNQNEKLLLVTFDEITKQKELETQLHDKSRFLERLSSLDGLTHIANRRYFDKYLELEWEQAATHSLPLSLLIVDIDFFKKYNDTYGYEKADQCLRMVAKALERSLTIPDSLVAHFDEKAFAILLPNTNLNDAKDIAELLRTTIEMLQIPNKTSEISDSITVSIGVGMLKTSPQTLINDSLQALQTAKANGRNQVR